MSDLTHSDLCEIAVKWLKRDWSAKGHGCHVAVAEVKSGHDGEIPDAIGFRSTGDHTDGSVVVEVKVSRSDFLNDFKKPHRDGDKGMGNWRYYMAPIGLISANELPDKWGLIEVNKSGQVKNIVGQAGVKGYSERNQALLDYWNDSNTTREMFLMVRLLARIEDAHKESSQIKEIYRANRLLVKRNSKLKSDKHRAWKAEFKLEQLQKRVNELEEEKQALAAHVERLKADSAQLLDIDEISDDEDSASVHANMNDVLIESPQTSLAEVRAKQAEMSFIAGVNCVAESDDSTNEAAKEHADKIREGGNHGTY